MKRLLFLAMLLTAFTFAGCELEDTIEPDDENPTETPQNPDDTDEPDDSEKPDDSDEPGTIQGYTEDAFPDPIFRAYVFKYFDTDGDGILSLTEAAAVTEIDVHTSFAQDDGKIKSLDGVQYFPNLTALRCYRNTLTTLDVSQNTALENLICSEMPLTTLDVSNNTALKVLMCDDNQLTTLDISKNTALTWLSCYHNQLTNLDVSHNTYLLKLYCWGNSLTSLDVSNNTALKDLQCIGNPLETLYLKKGCSINGITYNRSTNCIPEQTEIIFVD